MKKAITTSVAIALFIALSACAQSSIKGDGQDQQKSATTSTAESIPWPFQINPNGYKIVKGKRVQYGDSVPPGTSVTLEGEDKEMDAGHRFVSQLVSDNWSVTEMPKQKDTLWVKVAKRGPWEATIVSEPTKTAKLWRTRLEVRGSQNYDASKPPFEEMRQPPE